VPLSDSIQDILGQLLASTKCIAASSESREIVMFIGPKLLMADSTFYLMHPDYRNIYIYIYIYLTGGNQ
jgi:hypothetical protein